MVDAACPRRSLATDPPASTSVKKGGRSFSVADQLVGCLYRVMDGLAQQSILNLVPMSAHPDELWRLSDRYVEEVWSEFIGPTATILARRFGRIMEEHPGGAEVDLVALASGVGVQRSTAVKALERLHRFEIVHLSHDKSVVCVSGFAPSVRGGRVLRLTERGRLLHGRLLAASEVARSASPSGVVQPEVVRLSARRPAPARARAL